MKNKPYIILLAFSLFTQWGWGQADFRASLRQADPIPKGADLTIPEKIEIHRAFLDTVIREKNTVHQVYAEVMLATDFIKVNDFAEATRHLLAAEAIADAANELGWKGWIFYQKGIVAMRLREREEALGLYQTAASLCGKAGDSLCLAESLEQVSMMYGFLDNFMEAQRVSEQAMPLLKRFGGEKHVATATANFGTILSFQKRFDEAIPYFERAIEMQQKLKNPKSEAKALNNLADVYRHLKKYDLAMETFRRCIDLNTENKLPGNLLHNYIGLGLTYDSIGDFRASRIYFEKYEVLKDSLTGADTQRKIAELEIKYETQQKELELEKRKLELAITQRSLERRNWFIFLGLLLVAIGSWRWRWEKQRAKKELAEKQKSLNNVTRILMEKNQRIAELREQVSLNAESSLATSNQADVSANLYDLQILTNADWVAFKGYFEKAHPGLMNRLRTAFPTLTDAEERLFLFIKLNLNTKEAASILGISAESVKKTRNRLRKRLELEENVVLKEFIQNF